MPHDSVVTAADVLAALRQVRQVGLTASLEDLERREPELLAMLTEQASELHHRLGRLRVPPKAQRLLTRHVERLGLHLVLAHEAGQRRLWSDIAGDGPATGRP